MIQADDVRELVVANRRWLTPNVVALDLIDPAGAELPHWEPGAHLELLIEPDLVRHYSLCGSGSGSGERVWTIAVQREPAGRGGSTWIHERLHTGYGIRVRGPRNHFTLINASRYIFVAGGIGITPLIPMVDAIDRTRRPWSLTYGGRSRTTMAFAEQLVERYGDHISLVPEDECGLIDLAAVLGHPEPATAVYCCGPEPLLSAVESICQAWPSGALHTERFTARPQPSPNQDREFNVVLHRSGRTVAVPAGQTILATLDSAGVYVISSCQEGICGTCETTVIDGEIEHRDAYLTDEERAAGDRMMICVSRAAGERLVLDL
ncbi:PDR/VanB family oxidoreductase [Dactylosporangium sp. NPDC005572]|uniref:PDR/VanB family oxidoreductase n=1 Tax=Dactylosporangium sp. NPDC005572 TaxID=3156889 RepID=UPI0033AB0376